MVTGHARKHLLEFRDLLKKRHTTVLELSGDDIPDLLQYDPPIACRIHLGSGDQSVTDSAKR